MKKIFLLVVSLGLIFGGLGCSDDYVAEKEMWHAQKALKEILANPEATPPGQFELVANRFRNIIKKYPEWPGAIKAQWTIAEIYIAQKNYKQAEIELKKVIADHPKNKELCAQAKATIGTIYEIQNDWNRALSTYDELAKKYPYTSPGLTMPFYIANRYRSLKNLPKANMAYLEAIDKYELIIESNVPDKVKALAKGLNVKTQFALATLYEQEDRWPEALTILKRIKSEFPYSQEGLSIPLYIANHYKLKGEEAQANVAFSEALSYYQDIYKENEGKPLGLVALNLITTNYLNQEKWSEAIETQEKLIEKYPKAPGIPLALLNMAILYEQTLKDENSAIATYEKLIEKYPQHRLTQVAKKRVEKLGKEDLPENP